MRIKPSLIRYLLLILLGFLFFNLALALEEPMPVDQAFQLKKVYCNDGESITTTWDVLPGNYLYKDRFLFSILNAVPVTLGNPVFPETSLVKTYPDGRTMMAYTGHFSVTVPLEFQKNYTDRVKLQISYQGCSDFGICYPMQTKIVTVCLNGAHPTEIESAPQTTAPNNEEIPAETQQTKITHLLQANNFFAIIAAFFGIGVLLSLTPCVLPMIPILSGIIIGQKTRTHTRSFVLSLIYVLAMAITYAILGIIVGFIGSGIQSALQQPWIIVLFSLIFVAMALSLFGLYNLQLPNFLRNKIANVSVHQKRGSYLGTFVMGCLSTLVLSPCVTPPLASAIVFIGNSGNAVLGGVALFSMGIGMGVPLLIIGASSAKLLPKTGRWMNGVKYFLGVVMLGIAIWMLARIIPGAYSMALWALLAIGCAVGLKTFNSTTNRVERLGKAFGILLFIYGLLLLLGAIQGQTNPLKPFALFENRAEQNVLQFKIVPSLQDLNAEFQQAKQQNKPVLLDFYADWCIECKEMDAYTFTDPKVKHLLEPYILLRADITANSPQNKVLLHHFNIIAPPAFLFFNADGKEIYRIYGESSAAKFAEKLMQVNQKIANPSSLHSQ